MRQATRGRTWRACALALAMVAPRLAESAPVELSNAIYTVESPGATAWCDPGDLALSGGGRGPACATGAEAICGSRLYPAFDGPLAYLTGWSYSLTTRDGTVVTESTSVTCLAVSSFPELAEAVYLREGPGACIFRAYCDPGDPAVGGGGAPTSWSPSSPGATLDFDSPSQIVDDSEQPRVTGLWSYGFDHETDACYDNNTVYAVCARASSLSWSGSIYLVQTPGTRASCEPGDRVVAGGGIGPQCINGTQPACLHPVQYQHDVPLTDASGVEGWDYSVLVEGVGSGVDRTLAVCARGDPDGDGVTEAEGDCDPDDPAVAPDLDEVCDDGLDNDCDGLVDGDDVEDCPEVVPGAGGDDEGDGGVDAGGDAGAEAGAGSSDGDDGLPEAEGGGGGWSEGLDDAGGCACSSVGRGGSPTLVRGLLRLLLGGPESRD